jgi:hypothetical protein
MVFIWVGRILWHNLLMIILTLPGSFNLFHNGDVAAGADKELRSRSCLEFLKLACRFHRLTLNR